MEITNDFNLPDADFSDFDSPELSLQATPVLEPQKKVEKEAVITGPTRKKDREGEGTRKSIDLILDKIKNGNKEFRNYLDKPEYLENYTQLVKHAIDLEEIEYTILCEKIKSGKRKYNISITDFRKNVEQKKKAIEKEFKIALKEQKLSEMLSVEDAKEESVDSNGLSEILLDKENEYGEIEPRKSNEISDDILKSLRSLNPNKSKIFTSDGILGRLIEIEDKIIIDEDHPPLDRSRTVFKEFHRESIAGAVNRVANFKTLKKIKVSEEESITRKKVAPRVLQNQFL